MSKGHHFVGLDIGSSSIRVVIAQEVSEMEPLRVVGIGTAPSEGIRRGSVVNADAVAKACNAAAGTGRTYGGSPS